MATITVEQLRQAMEQTLQPDANMRKGAEDFLKQAAKNPGYLLVLLQLIESDTAASVPIRQAAAIHFKNLVKKGWDKENTTGEITISENERNVIKTNLVELMCKVPPNIQSQCCEAISLIAKSDYPDNWNNLMPSLVAKLNNPDVAIINGVLKTANSIFKSFRYAARSDALYAVILYSLEQTQVPLLALFKEVTCNKIPQSQNDKKLLEVNFETLRLICRIFFSLNFQDLPEFFEDNIKPWMEGFSTFLKYSNPLLEDPDEDTEPSPVDKVQAAIIENLSLYAEKDEEPFLPYLPNFTEMVWNLLQSRTDKPKHDILATKCIRFLSSLVIKPMHKHLFDKEETLRQIIGNIILPNLMIREVDEERFEDDPEEYIQTDLEGTESDSRRKCSQDLLRSMCRNFEEQATVICSHHITSMLAQYQSNPAQNWKAKDAAIHLMFGIVIRANSNVGVSRLNPQFNVLDFFSQHVYPEFEQKDHATRPMLKATAVKFVLTFRVQFEVQHLEALMPHLIHNMASPSVVVHTYAAHTIEKILTTRKDIMVNDRQMKFGSAQLMPFLEPLFTNLFGIINNAQLNENAYVMKCVMRSLHVASDNIAPVTQTVLSLLTGVLERVAKNPRNPQHNHYMFESIAVLVKAVCTQDASAVANFEALLFPPFQTILQMDVSEFTPYVFQILAQLLEFKAAGSPLGDSYTALFTILLVPQIWERTGNIPALTRLVSAYFGLAGAELAQNSKTLEGVLGVFQKLISSEANEQNAFLLLTSLIMFVPRGSLEQYMQPIFSVLLTVLSKRKKPRFKRLATNFFAVISGKYGASYIFQQINSIQSGLGMNLFMNVWVPRLVNDPPVRLDSKIQVVGLTRVLCEIPEFLAEESTRKVWAVAVRAVVGLVSSPDFRAGAGRDGAEDTPVDVEITYDSSYSSLHFANRPQLDPFAEITNPGMVFAQGLGKVNASSPGVIRSLIETEMKDNQKLSTSFNQLLSQHQINI